MPVEWTEDLATGVDQIDRQHQELYRQVARLHEAMRTARLDEVPSIVEFLQRYALEHFAAEEREMVATDYPGVGQHRRLHQRFVDDFVRQKAVLLGGPIAPTAVVALSQWLTAWLSDHVRTVDGDLARHLRGGA